MKPEVEVKSMNRRPAVDLMHVQSHQLEGLPYAERLRIGCNCVLWNCDGYALTYICVTALYLGVSMSVYQSSSCTAKLKSDCLICLIPINCIGDIVAMLDLRTLLSVLSTCGTVCQQTV